jgi:hypothetical protein
MEEKIIIILSKIAETGLWERNIGAVNRLLKIIAELD